MFYFTCNHGFKCTRDRHGRFIHDDDTDDDNDDYNDSYDDAEPRL